MTNKVMVIGLDGATFDLIMPWIISDDLPNIKKLMDNGSYGKMDSVFPVISASAWASFMTGVNPGKHGMIDFVKREKDKYKLIPVNRYDIKAKSLWKYLSEQGKRSIIINVPMTYPPEEINGIIVSGLGTPSNKIFTFPSNLSEKINKSGYRINKDSHFKVGNEDALLQEIIESTKKLSEIAYELSRDEWDLFMVVFRDTDEIGHFFWKHYDKTHPLYSPSDQEKYGNVILDYYKLIDNEIGKLISLTNDNTTIIIMSDHGQGPLIKDVYLNEWLRTKGYLVLKEKRSNIFSKIGFTRDNISSFLRRNHLSKVETLIKDILGTKIDILPKNNRPNFEEIIDWEKTSAYSYGFNGQIFINLQGREPQGIVEQKDYYSIIKKIINDFNNLLDDETKLPIVDQVITRDEYFSGEYLLNCPDLIVIMRNFSYITRQGFELINKGILFGLPSNYESASHRLEGMIILSGNQIIPNQQISHASIMDCMPTIMYFLGGNIPNGLDGKILDDVISSPKGINYYSPDSNSVTNYQEEILSESENEELIERLKNLGYLK